MSNIDYLILTWQLLQECHNINKHWNENSNNVDCYTNCITLSGIKHRPQVVVQRFSLHQYFLHINQNAWASLASNAEPQQIAWLYLLIHAPYTPYMQRIIIVAYQKRNSFVNSFCWQNINSCLTYARTHQRVLPSEGVSALQSTLLPVIYHIPTSQSGHERCRDWLFSLKPARLSLRVRTWSICCSNL